MTTRNLTITIYSAIGAAFLLLGAFAVVAGSMAARNTLAARARECSIKMQSTDGWVAVIYVNVYGERAQEICASAESNDDWTVTVLPKAPADAASCSKTLADGTRIDMVVPDNIVGALACQQFISDQPLELLEEIK